MVYCRLKETNEHSAIYSVGSLVADMTGEVEFFDDGRPPILLKQAEKEEIIPLFLNKLYAKYKVDFLKGEFKQKIAYEC